MRPRYVGGPNIAVKVPVHQFEATVTFYRDVLGLEEVVRDGSSIAFGFGNNRLWLDCVEHLSKSEIWLEIATDDVEQAASQLAAEGVVRRDEVESLPDDVKGFWVCDAASNILLIHEDPDPPV